MPTFPRYFSPTKTSMGALVHSKLFPTTMTYLFASFFSESLFSMLSFSFKSTVSSILQLYVLLGTFLKQPRKPDMANSMISISHFSTILRAVHLCLIAPGCMPSVRLQNITRSMRQIPKSLWLYFQDVIKWYNLHRP